MCYQSDVEQLLVQITGMLGQPILVSLPMLAYGVLHYHFRAMKGAGGKPGHHFTFKEQFPAGRCEHECLWQL